MLHHWKHDGLNYLISEKKHEEAEYAERFVLNTTYISIIALSCISVVVAIAAYAGYRRY